MGAVAKVVYRVGPVPDWYYTDIHDKFLEERLIETAAYLYGNDVTVEFGYNSAKPHQKKLFGREGFIISIHEYNPVALLNKVKKDADKAKREGLKPR